MNKKAHSLQLLLPLCLLAAFLLAAVLAVLLSASAYRSLLVRSDRLTEGTALSYLREKVRQSDVSGSIRVDDSLGCPALVIRQGEESLYDTYIYCYEGSLRELMIKAELEPAPQLGRELLPMERLELTLEGGLLRVRFVDSSGALREGLIALVSEEAP